MPTQQVELDLSRDPFWHPGALLRIGADYFMLIAYTCDQPVNHGLGDTIPAVIHAHVRELVLGDEDVLTPKMLQRAKVIEQPVMPDTLDL